MGEKNSIVPSIFGNMSSFNELSFGECKGVLNKFMINLVAPIKTNLTIMSFIRKNFKRWDA